jgi:hypothetical protein
MKILLVYNLGGAGSNFYRLEMPHHHLGENYPVELFSCANTEGIDFTKYDFVIFSRGIYYNGKTKEIAAEIKKHTKLVLDLDDYWQLGAGHILQKEWKQNKTTNQIREAVEVADHVICTTKYLAKSVKGINRNVHVVPNAVFPEVYKQFQCVKPEASYDLRLGWIGGTCHVEDIELLYWFAQDVFNQSLPVHFKFVHDGNKDGVYEYYKRIITNDYKNENYTALPTTDVYSYGLHYNSFDVALAPLRNTEFNTKKSELKVIEAGFHKKGLIVSDVKPYSDICNAKNSIVVKYSEDWVKGVKRLIESPALLEDLSEQLYLDVQKFHIAEVNKKRWEVYEAIAQK